MSSSYITGSGSNAYVGMGGLFRARLQQSDNPKLKALAVQLQQQDRRAKIMQDVISPQGFVGVDGKMKYIPGISFSKESALFDTLKIGLEISEESMKRQIDAFAKKRQDEKFDRLLEENRQNFLTKVYDTQREQRSERQKARLAATSAYLEKTFGINKQKTESSGYSHQNRPKDFQLFGPYTGYGVDFINNYTQDLELTSHFAPAISYDYDSNSATQQSIKISDYQYIAPTDTPSAYVVRLTGNGQYDPSKDRSNRSPVPDGKLTYQDIDGETHTISGSDIAELTPAEFSSLEYIFDPGGREGLVDADTAKFTQFQQQDFLSVMAVDSGEMRRGHVSKISLTRGDFAATPSASGDQIYHGKMMIPRGQYFNSFTLHADGQYISDGQTSANAADGTLLDMVNEGRIDIFAREIGYDTRFKVDADKSINNTLVFTKDSTQMVTDGIEFFITVKEADRDNISFQSLNIGTGKA